MVVINKEKVEKLKSIEEQIDSKVLNYYKASLAITEFLVRSEYEKGKK